MNSSKKNFKNFKEEITEIATYHGDMKFLFHLVAFLAFFFKNLKVSWNEV